MTDPLSRPDARDMPPERPGGFDAERPWAGMRYVWDGHNLLLKKLAPGVCEVLATTDTIAWRALPNGPIFYATRPSFADRARPVASNPQERTS